MKNLFFTHLCNHSWQKHPFRATVLTFYLVFHNPMHDIPQKNVFPEETVFFKKIFENKLHILLFCGKICLAIDSPQSFSKPNHSRPTRQNGDPYVRKQRHLTAR
jgi:hypothetical protein